MKKLFATVLVFAMVLCMFAGCNSGSNGGSERIKIGGIGPLTGGAAIYGNAVKNAMEIAVEEVNAKGGVQFELNFQDDAHDAESSVNAYGILMDWGMQVLVGPVTSTPAAAVAPEAEADGVFMLTPSASSVKAKKRSNALRPTHRCRNTPLYIPTAKLMYSRCAFPTRTKASAQRIICRNTMSEAPLP